MKTIKFSGRELSVLRAIDFATGTIGSEILLRTRMDAEEALDIMNGLLEVGFMETNPARFGRVELAEFETTIFETNPAYTHELKRAIIR